MKKRMLCLLLCLALVAPLCSCGASDEDSAEGAEVDTDFAVTPEQMFTDRDKDDEYDADGAIRIIFSDGGVSASSDSVSISGTTVTLTEEATYELSGTGEGMIIVDAPADAKPTLVLCGLELYNPTSAAIYVKECDKTVVIVKEGYENTLSCGEQLSANDDSNIDGAIFSREDLTVNGEGNLRVISPAAHGIVCKDDLVLIDVSLRIESNSHGVDANDSIRICRASISLQVGNDGLHSENEEDTAKGFLYMEIGNISGECTGDGLSASYYMQIEGGSLDITTEGKALKASGTLLVNGGELTACSTDDAIHSNTSVLINGGSFDLSTGDDGMHADETLKIVGGNINITDSYEGLEALTVSVCGGNIRIVASDDGINAAGGVDSSGFGGMGGDNFGGPHGGGMRPPRAIGSGTSEGKIEISGGVVYINASGDGIDANGSFVMSGGSVTVCGPTSGDTAVLDYDAAATITGGTFIGTGSYMMAQTFSSSEQGVLALTVGNQQAGTLITLSDSSGNELVSYSPTLPFQIVIISTPDMRSGDTYDISVGAASGSFEAS